VQVDLLGDAGRDQQQSSVVVVVRDQVPE